MNKSIRIHLCSSNRDLASERNAVLGWLEDCRVRTPGFSFFGSKSLPPLDIALKDVAASEVLVLIVGHLYGMISPGLNRSQEEKEYSEAVALGKTILVYLREEDAGRIPGSVERDSLKVPLLSDFRRRLQSEQSVRWFRDTAQLTPKVEEDLLALLTERQIERRQVGRQTLRNRTVISDADHSDSTDTMLLTPSYDSGTRTLPIYQKALSTPFSPSILPRHRGLMGRGIWALFLIPVLGIIVWQGKWLTRLSAPKNSSPIDSTQASMSNPLDTGTAIGEMDSNQMLRESDHLITNPSVTHSTPDPLALLLDKAKEGDTLALIRVGEMYDSGITLPQDDSLATSHYRRAAAKGMAEGEFRLAQRHLEGKGAKRSKSLAIFWLQSAATKGHPGAQSKLGVMYYRGQSVPRDETQGLKWLLKAADQKDPEAERILAEIKAH